MHDAIVELRSQSISDDCAALMLDRDRPSIDDAIQQFFSSDICSKIAQSDISYGVAVAIRIASACDAFIEHTATPDIKYACDQWDAHGGEFIILQRDGLYNITNHVEILIKTPDGVVYH